MAFKVFAVLKIKGTSDTRLEAGLVTLDRLREEGYIDGVQLYIGHQGQMGRSFESLIGRIRNHRGLEQLVHGPTAECGVDPTALFDEVGVYERLRNYQGSKRGARAARLFNEEVHAHYLTYDFMLMGWGESPLFREKYEKELERWGKHNLRGILDAVRFRDMLRREGVLANNNIILHPGFARFDFATRKPNLDDVMRGALALKDLPACYCIETVPPLHLHSLDDPHVNEKLHGSEYGIVGLGSTPEMLRQYLDVLKATGLTPPILLDLTHLFLQYNQIRYSDKVGGHALSRYRPKSFGEYLQHYIGIILEMGFILSPVIHLSGGLSIHNDDDLIIRRHQVDQHLGFTGDLEKEYFEGAMYAFEQIRCYPDQIIVMEKNIFNIPYTGQFYEAALDEFRAFNRVFSRYTQRDIRQD